MIAFFPGKFQPPHIGHIMTTARILNTYEKVIVGISGDVPKEGQVCSSETIKQVFETIFINEKERFSIIEFPGILTEYKTVESFPYFDILITAGNDKVIDWAKRLGIRYSNISRSEPKNIITKGTYIREKLCQ